MKKIRWNKKKFAKNMLIVLAFIGTALLFDGLFIYALLSY